MKEIADRILNGETVNIAGDHRYVLSVSKSKDWYRVGLVEPENLEDGSILMSPETMRDAGKRLFALADALERQKKFKNDERIYYVQTDGNIGCFDHFVKTNSFHLSLIVMGNAFKTKAEAYDNIPAVLTKYQELRDKGLV